ncbi:glycine-rich protein (plasmid) [Kitasatospora sp. NBC_00070]|uniref:glycine-rich protein n=1 Tax=Kitasatospora sp. NBC_00070 TaxID=2975962 RepID=UPI002F91AC2B
MSSHNHHHREHSNHYTHTHSTGHQGRGKHWRKRTTAIAVTASFGATAFAGLAATTAHADPSQGDPCVYTNGTVNCTYDFTGAAQTFTVPSGVTSATVTAYGAAGGLQPWFTGTGGPGGKQSATLSGLTNGQQLQVNVGGYGGQNSHGSQPQPGGWNGGGSGSPYNGNLNIGGGGASDVRVANSQGQYTLDDRIVVAGGGGGSKWGGYGGGLEGGYPDAWDYWTDGGGAYQTQGGSGFDWEHTGRFGVGANGDVGGGGGWYGGGSARQGTSGGGGSSHYGSANNNGPVNGVTSSDNGTANGGTFTPPQGINTHGRIVITASSLPNYQPNGLPTSATPLTTGQLYSFGTNANGNKMAMLKMQGDGNLLAYNVNSDGTPGSVFWASNTYNNNGATATFDTDGNLYIKKADGTVIKRTYIADNNGATLSLSPTTGLQITKNSTVKWSSNSGGQLVDLANYNAGGIPAGTTLTTNTVYRTGTINGSGNTMVGLVMQGDGNLVAYKLNNDGTPNYSNALWASNTYNNPGATASFTSNGELRVNNSGGTKIWGPDTTGGANSTFRFDSTTTAGQIHDSNGNLRWATGSVTPGTKFAIGGMITTGNYKTVLNGDGNLVTYNTSTTPATATWATNTWGNNGAYATFNTDGTLQIRQDTGGHDGLLWSENGSKNNANRLTQQSDGTLVIYNAANQATWANNATGSAPTFTNTTTLNTQSNYASTLTLATTNPGSGTVTYDKGPGSGSNLVTITNNGNGTATLARNNNTLPIPYDGPLDGNGNPTQNSPGWVLAQSETVTVAVTATNNGNTARQNITLTYNPYVGG